MEVASELERVPMPPLYTNLDLADCAANTITDPREGGTGSSEENGGGEGGVGSCTTTSGSSEDDDGGMDKLLEELMDIHGVQDLGGDEYSADNGPEGGGLEGESIIREAFGGGAEAAVPVQVKTRGTEEADAASNPIVTGTGSSGLTQSSQEEGGKRKESDLGVTSTPSPAGGRGDSGPKRAAVNLMIPAMPMLTFAKKGGISVPSRESDKQPLLNGLKNLLEKKPGESKSDTDKGSYDDRDDDIVELPRDKSHVTEVRVPENETNQQSGSDSQKNVRNNNDVSKTNSAGSTAGPSRKEAKFMNGENRSKPFKDKIELGKEEPKSSSVSAPVPKTKPPSDANRVSVTSELIDIIASTDTEGTNSTENRPGSSHSLYNHHRKKSQYKQESAIVGQQIMSNKCKRSNETADLNKFKCLICGQDGFVLFTHLKSHREETHPTIPFTAENEMPFACGVCGKQFHVRKNALVCAILGHDPTSLRKQMFRYACSQCPKETFGFHSIIALKKHWEIEHYSTFQLDTASKTYEEEEDPLPSVVISEKEAMKIKSGDLPPDAEFSLIVERDLINIKDINDKDKTKHIHLCTVCNARLDTNYELNNHMQTHTAPAPKKPVYKCNKCPEEFVKLTELRNHFKVHLKSSKKSILRARKNMDKGTSAKHSTGPGLGTLGGNGSKGKVVNRGRGRPRNPIISNEAMKSNTSSTMNLPDEAHDGTNEITKNNLTRLASGIRNAIKNGSTLVKKSSNMEKRDKRMANTQSEEQYLASPMLQSESPLHLHPIKLFKCNICVLHAFTSLKALQKHKKSAHQPHSVENTSENEKITKMSSQLIHAEIMRNPGFVLVKRYESGNNPEQEAIGNRAATRLGKDKNPESNQNKTMHPSKKRRIENTNEEDLSGNHHELESPYSPKGSRPGPRSRKKFQCEICPRSFRKQRVLNEHRKIHAEDQSTEEPPTVATNKTEMEQAQEETHMKRGPGRPRKSILPPLAVSSVALSFMEKKEDPVGDGGANHTTREEGKRRTSANKLLPSLLTSLSGRSLKTKKLHKPTPSSNGSNKTNVVSQHKLKNVQIICEKLSVPQSDTNQVKADIPKSNQPLERPNEIETRGKSGKTPQNKSKTGEQQRRLRTKKGDPPEVASTSPENAPMTETKAKREEVSKLTLITPKKRGPGRPSKKILPATISETTSSPPRPSLLSQFQITKEVEIILTKCDDESFRKSKPQKTLQIPSSSKQKKHEFPPNNKTGKANTARKVKTPAGRSRNDNVLSKGPHNCTPPSTVTPAKCQMLMFKKDHRNFVDLGSAFSSTSPISENHLKNTTPSPAAVLPRTSGITPSTSRNRKRESGESATVSEKVVVKKPRTYDPGTPRIPRNGKELTKDVSCPIIFKGNNKSKGGSPKAVSVPAEIPCKQCGRPFPNEKALRQHLVMAHMSSKVATTRSTRPKSTSVARKSAPLSVKLGKNGRKTFDRSGLHSSTR